MFASYSDLHASPNQRLGGREQKKTIYKQRRLSLLYRRYSQRLHPSVSSFIQSRNLAPIMNFRLVLAFLSLVSVMKMTSALPTVKGMSQSYECSIYVPLLTLAPFELSYRSYLLLLWLTQTRTTVPSMASVCLHFLSL